MIRLQIACLAAMSAAGMITTCFLIGLIVRFHDSFASKTVASALMIALTVYVLITALALGLVAGHLCKRLRRDR